VIEPAIASAIEADGPWPDDVSADGARERQPRARQ
jgi:hypothetical protein